MNVEMFELPTFTIDHLNEVEHKYCNLINMYRQGESLDPELMDWMDSANNWLMTVTSKT